MLAGRTSPEPQAAPKFAATTTRSAETRECTFRPGYQDSPTSGSALRRYLTASLSALTGRARIFLLAGFAGIVTGAFVNGLIP